MINRKEAIIFSKTGVDRDVQLFLKEKTIEMKIYEAIKKDHDIQRNLCKQIIETSGASEERKKLWRELKKELEVHAVAEERYFYSPLIETDKMQEDARHGMAEHHEMDKLIEELDDTDMSSPHWIATLEKLVDKVEHHLEDEEEDFFGKAKKVYSQKEEDELASAYEESMEKYRKGWPASLPGNQE
jgi:SMC interacting uncharacterized protein involved in chromosome segregation